MFTQGKIGGDRGGNHCTYDETLIKKKGNTHIVDNEAITKASFINPFCLNVCSVTICNSFSFVDTTESKGMLILSLEIQGNKQGNVWKNTPKHFNF